MTLHGPVAGTSPLLPGYNPATWMLEVTGGSMATMVETVKLDWPDIFEKSGLAALVGGAD